MWLLSLPKGSLDTEADMHKGEIREHTGRKHQKLEELRKDSEYGSDDTLIFHF